MQEGIEKGEQGRIVSSNVLNRLTKIRPTPYSDGMISEFHDLSEKIDRLAELTHSLRIENAQLRQSNALLSAENISFMERLSEAQRRVEALLTRIPGAPELPQAPAESAAVTPEVMPAVTPTATHTHTNSDEAAQ